MMKKFNILLSVALGIGFAACDNLDETPIPTNPQLPPMTADNVSVTLSPELSSETAAIDLKAYDDKKASIPVLLTQIVENLPENYDLDMVMEISNTEEFNTVKAVETNLDPATGVYSVTAQAWQDAHFELFGQSPRTRVTYVRFAGYAVNGSSSVNLGGPDFFFAEATVNVTPYPGGVDVQNIYVPGDANSWSFSTILPPTGDDLFGGYAHLKGSFKFTGLPDWDQASAAGCNWGSGVQPGVLYNGSNDNFSVDVEGLYNVDVNLLKLSYTLTLVETVGIVGEHNNWDEKNPVIMTPDATFTVWTAEVDFPKAGAEWKFVMNKGWDLNLGGDQYKLTKGGANLKSEAAGKTTITLDLSAYPYSFY